MPHRVILNNTPDHLKATVSFVLLGATNFGAWVQSINAGMIASAITLIGGSWLGLRLMKDRNDLTAANARAEGQDKARRREAATQIKVYRATERAKILIAKETDEKLGTSLSREVSQIRVTLSDAHEAVLRAEKTAADAKLEASQLREDAKQARAEARQAQESLISMIRDGNDRAVRHTDKNRQDIIGLQRQLAESEVHLGGLVSPAAKTVEEVAVKVDNIEKIVTGSNSGVIMIPEGFGEESP